MLQAQSDIVCRNLVDGEWLGQGDSISIENPSDLDTPVGRFVEATPSLIDDAVSAARQAFPAWRDTSSQFRADLLERVAGRLASRSDELAVLLASEEGKTLSEARSEVGRAVQIMRYYAGEAIRSSGELIPSIRAGIDIEITREPVGVIAVITPWNFPIAIPAWKLAPALAYGNCTIIKPSELAPASAHALVSILVDCGVPRGVVGLINGGGSAGADLVRHPGVDAISFTGSVATGKAIREDAAPLGRRVQCEMGGKNPLVVVDDADLGRAVDGAVNAAFHATGQRCTAASRLIVTAGVYDRFRAALIERMNALKVGHALSADTNIGPVVSAARLAEIRAYLDAASSAGAQIEGGRSEIAATRGHFLRPAVVLDARTDAPINREEVFGPVASLFRADDLDHAIEIANDTDFGLVASIYTSSLSSARQFRRAAQTGMVMVNLPTAGVDYHVPFGGRKASSFGPREQGTYAREFYTTVKASYLAY